MSTLSNSQGLMFAEISTEETKDPQDATLKGWFSAQQTGQAKATITDAVRAAKGVVTHTVGDAMLSSFPDAPSALKAALDVQRRLAKSQDRSAKTRIKVRAGLAFGPVRVIAGKVSGDAVAAAGVLLEKARPGEILIDQAMKDALGQFDYVTLSPQGQLEGVSAYRVTDAGAAAPDFSLTQPVRSRPDLTPAPRPPPAPAPAPTPAAAPQRRAAAGAIVLRYGNSERRFTSADGEITLGRAVENHINVPAVHVSRRHAKIVWEGKVPVLVNLSQNGSCVRFDETGRQQPCESPVPLHGSGAIALAERFGQFSSSLDVVQFKID
jgi:hypothetical protein